MNSHSFYILHRPIGKVESDNMKAVVMAPINSSNIICTDTEFYHMRQNNSDSGK